MKKNIYIIIAAINVYGLNIYGTLYLNTECGKGNLEDVLKPEKCDCGRLVSLSSLRDYTKVYLKLLV